MKNLILLICLLVATFSCKIGDNVSPSTAIEVFNSSAVTLIGSPISKVIGVAGGSLALPSAGANVIVPAGAMAAGASLTVQATTDMLDSEGQGIQISGTWSKPITLEYNYAADDLNPESNMIAFQTPKGNWITSRKVKVDKTKRTFAIRLGQNNTANARLSNGRPMANTYSFAASNEFFLKPNVASVDLGGTVKFTAFARQGDTRGYWRKTSKGTYFYEDGDLEPLSQPSDKTAKIEDDDELVPLAPYVKPASANLDDELVPLSVVIKEAAFTNTKEGYTRKWSISGVGTIANKGSIGADYKAPSDASAKGKTVTVTFKSVNNKTGQPLEASAKVFIKDGLTRYRGTFSFNEFYLGDDPSLAYPTKKISVLTVHEGNMTLISNKEGSTTFIVDIDKPKSAGISTYELNKTEQASTGEEEKRTETLIIPALADWSQYNKSQTTLTFENNNTYQISFRCPTKGGEAKTLIENNRHGSYSVNSSFSPSTTFISSKDKTEYPKNTDLDLLSGSKTWTTDIRETSSNKVIAKVTYTAKWNFKKI